jgi:hypothetical protein
MLVWYARVGSSILPVSLRLLHLEALRRVIYVSLHPSDKGSITEAVVLAELAKVGWTILIPFGTNHRYDYVIDRGQGFERVQCKTGRYINGSVQFNSYSHSRDSKESCKGYAEEADVFAIFCPELDSVYWVPVDEVPVSHICVLILSRVENILVGGHEITSSQSKC